MNISRKEAGVKAYFDSLRKMYTLFRGNDIARATAGRSGKINESTTYRAAAMKGLQNDPEGEAVSEVVTEQSEKRRV